MSEPKILYRFTGEEIDNWPDGWRNQMITWAKLSGLVPEYVRSATGITVEEIDGRSMIRYHRFVRNERGHTRIVPGTDEPECVEELVPMAFLPPVWVRRIE